MSKIIRHVEDAPAISIGGKRFDFETEAKAERTLARFCPAAEVQTDSDGCKLLPILEVFKLEKTFEEAKQKSQQQGFEAGHREGLQKGLAEAQKVLGQFDQAIKDAVESRESLFEEARRNILNLVVQISHKVTFEAISVDPEATLTLIDGVINSLIDRSRLKIKVHPDHLPIVEQNIERFLKGSTAIKEITIEADPRVRYGGCFIETPSGDIDARLESQFKVIEETVFSDGNQS